MITLAEYKIGFRNEDQPRGSIEVNPETVDLIFPANFGKEDSCFILDIECPCWYVRLTTVPESKILYYLEDDGKAGSASEFFWDQEKHPFHIFNFPVHILDESEPSSMQRQLGLSEDRERIIRLVAMSQLNTKPTLYAHALKSIAKAAQSSAEFAYGCFLYGTRIK